MIQPPYLKKGDKIAIVSPARRITFEEVFPTMKLFQKWGFEVVLGTHVFGSHHQFSGTDDQRLQDFQKMLNDPTIRAVISARGGYGTVRIIDKLDFDVRQLQAELRIIGGLAGDEVERASADQ